MRAVVTLSLVLLLFASASFADTQAELTTEYYMAIGDYYDVPYDQVVAVSEAGIIDEELPVIFFIADRTGVEADEISKMRLDGESFSDICRALELCQSAFYMIVSGDIESKSYAPIFEVLKSVKPHEWAKVSMPDRDIVNLTNLKMIYSHHDYSAYIVMAMKDYGKGFAKINHQIRLEKEKLIRKQEMAKLNRD